MALVYSCCGGWVCVILSLLLAALHGAVALAESANAKATGDKKKKKKKKKKKGDSVSGTVHARLLHARTFAARPIHH